MKPSSHLPIHRGGLFLRLRGHCAAVLVAVAAFGLSADLAFSQGNFYPVNPPTTSSPPPSSGNYTGSPYINSINGATYNELAYVESFLSPSNLTLRFPVPAGKTLATDAQLTTAVTQAAQQLAQGGSAPAGVSLASLAREIVGNRASAAVANVDAIAQAIIQFSSSSSNANTQLNNVTAALASAYPSSVSNYTNAIFQRAAANAGTAPAISTLAATATTPVAGNDQSVGAIVGQALNQAAGSVLTSGAKQNLLKNIVTQQFAIPAISNAPASISVISQQMTTATVLAAIPLPTMLTAAVNALQAAGTTGNMSVGAIVVGALSSQPGNAATIRSTVGSANSPTQPYTNMIVDGYSNGASNPGSETAYNTFLAANKNFADAIVAGATIQAGVPTANLIKDALQQSAGGTALPADIVASAVTANLTANPTQLITGGLGNTVTIVSSTIDPSTHQPYNGTYQNVAQGAASAARTNDTGMVAYTLISKVTGWPNALPSGDADVKAVVDGAITGAYSAGKQRTVSDIVFQAEKSAWQTSSASTAVADQAVRSIKTQDATAPTYIAAAAALTGYVGVVGANSATLNANARASIYQAAKNADASVNGGAEGTAIDLANNVVNSFRTNSAKGYTQTLGFYTSASGAADQTLAVLYASSLASPNETSAMLAAAIKQTTVAPSALLAAAQSATSTRSDALSLVSAVATHIKAEISNPTDILDYVGYQVAQNSAYIKDVATAAVVVDPNHSHYVAHAVAFNNPQNAFTTVSSVFAYAQITSKPKNNTANTPIDMASAAAAISAAYTTGIIETRGSATVTDAAVKTAIVNAIQAAVLSAITQNGTPLQGAVIAQSTGATASSSTSKKSTGAAGVITGFIAQASKAGDTTIGDSGGDPTVKLLDTATVAAVLTGAATGQGGAYALEIAQAAGQALRWVSSAVVLNTAATDIANAINAAGTSYTIGQLYNAASFGITQAAGSIVGAGASGISAAGNYSQHSATGLPVTDIFNL